ncbi:MAG: polysaccharide deacetylase family protein [bacterium]
MSIFTRYGLNSHRFSKSLIGFVHLLRKYDITPTLPVTATVLDKHADLFRKIKDMGVEFAVHGYKHMDYTHVDIDKVYEHNKLAMDLFHKHGIHCSGYRYPYLRRDDERIHALKNMGFQWDSSHVISWNSLNPDDYGKECWDDYQRILKTYNASDAEESFSLPSFRNNLVELPVSVPDDDILVERLGVLDGFISQIWERMVTRIRDRGELLVMQCHPERFAAYKEALEKVIQLVKLHKDCWTESLGEIAEWWRERDTFRFDMKALSHQRYRIKACCTDRATILMKNGGGQNCGTMLFNSYYIVDEAEWDIESPVKPIIGIDGETSDDVIGFVRSEGYPYELTEKPEEYSVFLRHRGDFGEREKRQVLENIDKTPKPFIRFWRWPYGARYSLAITGDIDGVSIWDFLGRLNG